MAYTTARTISSLKNFFNIDTVNNKQYINLMAKIENGVECSVY